jgi:sugar phosphate permease
MNQPEPSVGIVRAVGGSMVAIVALCVIFDQGLWPVAFISAALAVMGASIVYLMYDKEKKW